MAKQINTVKDLEGIQPMDIVMINSYTKFNPDVPAQNVGFYGGSFDINNEKYLVVSETISYKESKDRYFVSSSLYKVKKEDGLITDMVHNVAGPCNKNPSDLETEITKHLNIFKTGKLNELKTRN